MNGFWHGVILAFGLIIPLGVQNMFVFSQGAAQPTLKRALPAVITAAVCDTLLIIVAVQGVSLLIIGGSWLKNVLLASGCIFLVHIGWTIWHAQPRTASGVRTGSTPVKKQVMFAAGVSLLNPHAIMDTIGVIGTNSLKYSGQEKWLFMIACAGVSWLWFLSLAMLGRILGQRQLAGDKAQVFNRFSAAIIWASALYMLYEF